MGRAIDQDNRLDDHERRLKLIEDALEEMIQTKVHHVDLHDELDKHEAEIRKEKNADEIELKPDEEYTAPVGKRKKTTKAATVT